MVDKLTSLETKGAGGRHECRRINEWDFSLGGRT